MSEFITKPVPTVEEASQPSHDMRMRAAVTAVTYSLLAIAGIVAIALPKSLQAGDTPTPLAVVDFDHASSAGTSESRPGSGNSPSP